MRDRRDRLDHLSADRKGRTFRRRSGLYFDDPVAWANDCIRWPTGRDLAFYQEEVLAELVEYGREAVRGPHGLGKDLSVETLLPTPTGWTTMGEVRRGDVLLDEQGRPCRVLHAEDPQWRDAYRVHFADGSSVVAGAGHLWNAVDVYNRPKVRRDGRRRSAPVEDWRDHWAATSTVETRQIAATVRTRGGQLRWRVPTAKPLDLPAVDLPIDPYLFGYWLGDGKTSDGVIFVGAADATETVPRLGALVSSHADKRTGCLTVRPVGLRAGLRTLGALGHKHIPASYLRASIEQRRALVQGLWDSDGYRQDESDEITLTDKRLAADVAELLRTLGLAVRVRESDATLRGRVVSRRWRIAARFDFDPYRLARYDWKPRGSQASRHTQRTITAVAPVGLARTRCIAVDSPSRLFLAGEDMIPTHNTAIASIAILWFATTRDAAGADWKVPTTASVGRQLQEYLWPEIHKWARLLDWDKIGRDPFDERKELLQLHLKLRYGSAFALASSEDPSGLEGAHADELLYLFDESKAVPDAVFDAAEGAFSTAGLETGTNAYALAISTPGEPSGRFYAIHARRAGTEDWHAKHVTLDDAIKAGRITREWAEQRKLLWGEESAVYQNRVLGEFAAASEDSVIPLGWVELANNRWRDLYEPLDPGTDRRVSLGKPRPSNQGTTAVLFKQEKCHTLGVDVARGGEDRSVIALRRGNAIAEMRRLPYSDDVMRVANTVVAIQEGHGMPRAIVDVIGIGAGVFDRVREQNYPCSPFNASEATRRHDLTGEFGFFNVRSWAWWNMREMLDPTSGCDVALPPDDRLTGDLTAPKWKVMAGGKIRVEGKDDIRKRISRSTDDGDACVQAFTESGGSWGDLYRDMSNDPPPDPDEPQPIPKRARSGGWGNVYAQTAANEAEAAPVAAMPAAVKATDRRALDERALSRPCQCGNLRLEHEGEEHLGACTEDGCPCDEFTPRA